MLAALVAGSGFVASAAMSLASGATQGKLTSGALQQVQHVDESSMNSSKDVVTALAPSVIDLGDSVQDIRAQVEESIAQRQDAAENLHLPLIDVVGTTAHASKQAADNLDGVKSNLAESRSKLQDMHHRYKGVSNNRDVARLRSDIRGQKLQSDIAAAHSDALLRAQKIETEMQRLRDRVYRGQ